jgi:hypothetical protein
MSYIRFVDRRRNSASLKFVRRIINAACGAWVGITVRAAVSGTVIALVVVVVVVVAGAGAYFALGLGSSTGPSTTHTSSSNTQGGPSADSLNASVNAFISAFNHRDVTTIKTFFTSSSAIAWTGVAGGLQGTYTGTDGAGIVYGTSVGHTSTLSANVSRLHTQLAGSTGTVGFRLNITGSSNVVGPFNSTADISQVWVYQGGTWTIQTDDWNYLDFVSNNPSQATVFPQWGLTLNGKAPSLAGEHVLEWNVAPYLAVGVYATIVALGLALIWVRVRRQKQ